MRLFLLAVASAALSAPAAAQHAGHHMPAASAPDPHAGHKMPDAPADPHAGHVPAVPPPADPHAGHGSTPAAPADPHAGHAPAPALPPTGSATAPAAPADHAADGYYAPDVMAAARAQLRREHGGGTFAQLIFDLAEYRAVRGRDGYAWQAEGWYGGDIHRVVVKTESEGVWRGPVESAEVQLLYSRALDPYWNLQAGFRHDIRPDPPRSYAVLGVEGVAPYWIAVEGALFLSDKGDAHARLEAHHDLRLSQRLILQPRGEVSLAFQDVPELGIESGVNEAELGLRLRYEIVREFAPYLGVHWQRRFGESARLARAHGDDVAATAVVMGVRAWF